MQRFLLDALTDLRKAVSKIHGVAPYQVFNRYLIQLFGSCMCSSQRLLLAMASGCSAALEDMARFRPTTKESMEHIEGVSEARSVAAGSLPVHCCGSLA